MKGSSPYAEPRTVTSLDDCYFYHTVEIPGHSVVTGEWDLRPGLDAYLGHFDFAGKRVLDVGAASGILSFHVERQGAEYRSTCRRHIRGTSFPMREWIFRRLMLRDASTCAGSTTAIGFVIVSSTREPVSCTESRTIFPPRSGRST